MSDPSTGSVSFSRRGDDTLLVTMSGEIDLAAVNDEHYATVTTLAAAAKAVDVDLSATSFLDSVGLGFLVTIRNASTTTPCLFGVSARTRNLLKVIGIEALFTYDDDGGP